MFLDPSPRCSFVALKQLCTKKCGRNCRLDIGLVTIPGHQQFSRNHVMYWFHALNLSLPFFDFGSVSSLLRLHTWRIPGYPSTTSRACRVSLSAVGNCILGPMGFMGSNSLITGTLTHESEIKGTDFHGQWPTSNGLSCVFFTLTRSPYSFS